MKKNSTQVLHFFKNYFSKIFLALILIIGLSTSSKSQNLLYNGDFEYGGSGNGFVSNDPSYFYLATPNGTSFAGNWAITNNPQLMNGGFDPGTDHSGTGNMMVVDGTTNGGAKRFWKAGNNGNGIIGFITGTSYTFSYWIKSLSNDPSRANIGVAFSNASNVTLTSGSATAPLASDGWQQVKYTFIAGASNTVTIEMYDNITTSLGNDFAIDDIELFGPPQPFSFSYSSVNPTCSNVSDGSIAAYGTGGTPPYLYSFDGGPFTSTNVLNGLTTSTHTVSVQDAALNSLTSPTINIISPTDVLDATTNKDSICSGHSATLNATGGGNNGYTWVATPSDPTLTVNAASPVVSPLVPTIYVVSTSSTYITNLVFNGDFELGNNGFSTDYVFKTSNTSGAQRTYGITDSASKFYSAFSNCGDHTSGSGKMFVCDGSTNPTNRIWSQTVPVKPGSTYTFTYWIQSVTSPSPAQIETRINNIVLPAGTSANPFTAPATNACNNWQKVSYSWTAGVGVTSADLSIYDKNFVDIGNDFALDDISFITLTTTCTLVDSVKVFVTTTTSSITDFSYSPNAICVGSLTNPTLNKVSSFTTGGIYTATPAGLKIDSLTGAIDVANSLPNTYNVTYFAPVVGCRLGGSSSTTLTIRPLITTPTASVTFQPTCTTPTGIIVVSNPLATNYYFSADSGLNYQSSPTFTGLAPSSTHYIIAKDTNSGGCISDTISLTINPITPNPATPTGSVSAQPTCALSTGTIIVSSPHGLNYVYSVGGVYQTDTTFTGLAANTTYSLTVKDLTTGCISTALSLSVNPFVPVVATTNTQTFSSCKDIVYNTITYSASTVLKDTVKSFQGCDSIYNIVNININPITTTTNTQTFNSCKDIVFNAITYSASTILKDTVKSFQGCDSIYNIVNININPITTTTNTQTFSSCKDIVYNSITYSASTVLKDTVKSFQGCDSIYNIVNININPITTTTNTQTFSSCKNIVYNAITYSASTILKDTVKSFQGCDSIYNIVNININPITTTTNTQTFNSCKDIVFNAITYSASTVLKDTVKSFQGCDSIYNVVNININPITTTTNTQTFSSCKDIVYNTITYSSSTVLKDTVKSFQGCDSIYNIVNININPITTTTNTQTFSSCKDIVYNTITYSASTVLKDTVKSFQGCDSIYNIVNININPITTTTNTQTFSSCKDIVYNAITYSASTILKDTVKSFQGCDSIYNIVNININPITTTTNTQTFSSCKDIVYNTITYSASTVLKDTVKSFQGCDSIYNIVNININPITTTTNTQTFSSCKDIVYIAITYSSSTVLKDTVKSFQGCDSIYNIVNININPISVVTNNTSFSGCGSVIYKGNTYTSSISLKDTVKSFQGCDSIYNVANITVFTVPNAPTASVTVQPICLTPTGTIVITAPIGANYQYSVGGIYQTSTTFSLLNPNIYSVTVKDVSSGCISSALNLTINPVPAAPAATISYAGNPFFNQGTATVTVSTTATITSGTYTATPAGLSINSSTGAIDLANSAVGNYVVTYSFNSGVCSNTATTNVTINQLKGDIYIPNTFTPNGDGKNDIWYLYGNTIKSVNITVFNQWGERIFNSTNQSKGWDGIGFGRIQPTGVYIFATQIVLLDGTVLNRKGTVNLIR
jgi:gliding motility-associated-like protein